MELMSSFRKCTSTRGGLVGVSRDFNLNVINFHLSSQPADSSEPRRPTLIFINGSAFSGKSLIWDELVASLLGGNPEQELKGHNRSLERWKGFNKKAGAELRLYACNLKGIVNKVTLKTFLDSLNAIAADPKDRAKLLELGDIIILNNTDYPGEASKLPQLLLVPDFSVTIFKDDALPLESWKRSVEIVQHTQPGLTGE